MSIRYDLHLTNGVKKEVTYVCFGYICRDNLASGRIGDSSDFSQNYDQRPHVPMGLVTYHLQHRDSCNSRTDWRVLLAEARELVNSFKFLRESVLIERHPQYGVVAKVKCTDGIPVDHTVMSLFWVRNFFYNSTYYKAYKNIRERGYNCKFAAVIASFFYSSSGWMEEDGLTWYCQGLGEYNNVNPSTMTRSDLIALLRDEDIEWYQGPWTEDRFYVRDYYFHQNRITFRGDRRKMLDVMNRQRDTSEEPIMSNFPEGQYSEDAFGEVLTYFEELFTEASIPFN